MSNTAPELNALAAEQSHKIIPATSSTLPKRFKGLAAIIAFTTSLPSRLIRSVSMGPGATQFTRMPVSRVPRAYHRFRFLSKIHQEISPANGVGLLFFADRE